MATYTSFNTDVTSRLRTYSEIIYTARVLEGDEKRLEGWFQKARQGSVIQPNIARALNVYLYALAFMNEELSNEEIETLDQGLGLYNDPNYMPRDVLERKISTVEFIYGHPQFKPFQQLLLPAPKQVEKSRLEIFSELVYTARALAGSENILPAWMLKAYENREFKQDSQRALRVYRLALAFYAENLSHNERLEVDNVESGQHINIDALRQSVSELEKVIAEQK